VEHSKLTSCSAQARLLRFGLTCVLTGWLAVTLGADEPEKTAPPLPAPKVEEMEEELVPSVFPDQSEAINALTPEELEQILLPVDLQIKKPDGYVIRTEARVMLDEEDESRGFIQPPPMQSNLEDSDSEVATLHLYYLSEAELVFAPALQMMTAEPICFEDPCLERHGESYCDPIQFFASGLRFYKEIPVAPFCLLKDCCE